MLLKILWEKYVFIRVRRYFHCCSTNHLRRSADSQLNNAELTLHYTHDLSLNGVLKKQTKMVNGEKKQNDISKYYLGRAYGEGKREGQWGPENIFSKTCSVFP